MVGVAWDEVPLVMKVVKVGSRIDVQMIMMMRGESLTGEGIEGRRSRLQVKVPGRNRASSVVDVG